jgi:N-formylmaleamate deformylase
MPNWSDGYLTANNLKIHYYRTGGDKPPVVINHGAGDDGLCWTRLAQELEADYDLILPDARGHGLSDPGNGDYSSEQRAADLAGLIQALGLDRPIVGGHSMGADASLHLAANYPALTRGVFLEDPPIFQPGETMGPGMMAHKMENVGKLMARTMRLCKRLPDAISVFLARRMFSYPEAEIAPWIASKKRVSDDFLNSMPQMKLDLTYAFEAFQKITVPALLFTGDKEKGSIVSQDTAREAVRLNGKVQVVHLAGASHDIRRARFYGYLTALKLFCEKVEAMPAGEIF